jgi:predicted RecA/RadA family phage recombinase
MKTNKRNWTPIQARYRGGFVAIDGLPELDWHLSPAEILAGISIFGAFIQTPATWNGNAETIPVVPAAAVNPGDVNIIGTFASVATEAVSANQLGALAVSGKFFLPKDTSVFAQGDPVFWNPTGTPQLGTASTGCATSTPAGVRVGQACQAQVTGDNYVLTKLLPESRLDSHFTPLADAITNVANTDTAFATTATIPAGLLEAGDIISVKATGVVTGQNGANTNTVKLKILTATNTYTAIVNTGAVNAAANGTFIIDVDLIFGYVGASGGFTTVGAEAFGAPGTATLSPVYLANTAINTNTAITIEVTDQVNAASAGNVIQLLELNVARKNK